MNSWANLFIRTISREIIGLNFLMSPVNVQCVLTLELGGSGIRMGGYQNFWLQVPWISCIHTCTRCHVAKFLWSFRIENEKVDDEFMYVVCCTKIFYAHTTKCWKKFFLFGCVLRMMVSEKCIGCPLANICLVNTEETKECDI